jgi:hypothetical protein
LESVSRALTLWIIGCLVLPAFTIITPESRRTFVRV